MSTSIPSQHTKTNDWPGSYFAGSAWYAALQPTLVQLAWQRFPQPADWLAIPPALRPHTRTGHAIHFIDPDLMAAESYEARIARSGQVATRPDNWHDAFNALCWLAWPNSKAALNACHLQDLLRTPNGSQGGTPQRSRRRDTATLFDESGLVIATDRPELLAGLAQQDWQHLFVHQRADWQPHLLPLVFGHALLEKGLAPYLGLVGRCLVLPVSAACLRLAPAARLARLDLALSCIIADGALVTPAAIPPLPLLGIPGWWPEQDAAFYADRAHFRQRNSQAPP